MSASPHLRRLAARAAPLLGAAFLALGAVGLTLARVAFDAATFGDRAAASLEDPRVAAWTADRITRAVLAESPDLTPVRPLVLAAAEGLTRSAALQGLVRTAARSANEAFFAEGTRQVVLSLPDVGILLRGAFERASPELAARIPPRMQGLAERLEVGAPARVVVALGDLRRGLAGLNLALLAAGSLLLVAGVALSRDRRDALARAGVALFAAGLAVAVVRPLGEAVAPGLADDPRAGAALAGLWSTCAAGLQGWGELLAGLGVLLAAASGSLLERFEPRRLLARAGEALASPPTGRRGRLLWGLGVAAAGGAVLLAPALVLRVAGWLLGATLVLVGVRELFRLVLPPARAEAAGGAATRGSLLRAGLAVALAAGLAAAWLAWRDPLDAAAPAPDGTCNGDAALCARRVDQVAFAGAHNAMSHADTPDWMFPHHGHGIPRQLRDGVRALLIDVHVGLPGAARIKTDLRSPRPTTEALEQALGPEGLAAAMRIRERLVGADDGSPGLYLCHGFCELGATPLVETLRAIRHFLVQEPGTVLLLVVEDYAPPDALARAFEASGLAERVYRGPAGPPWPRLGELVAAGTNVLVFLESGRAGVPWLRPAFAHLQETPYTFHAPEDFSCAPNRGGTAGSLLQINHWIETTPTPLPSNADLVNARAVLGTRARQCARERGRLPNVVAVDFYDRGDLLAVVADLNADPPREAP